MKGKIKKDSRAEWEGKNLWTWGTSQTVIRNEGGSQYVSHYQSAYTKSECESWTVKKAEH